jgi:hypothetical protein
LDHHHFFGWMTIFILVAGLPAGGPRYSGALVSANPVRLEIGAGQVETLQILLVNADKIYGIDLQAAFDPAVVQVVDVDPGQTGVQMIPGAFLKPDFTVRNLADNKTGTLRYVNTQLAPASPASGTGIILSVRFRGKTPGTHSQFIITSAVIADRRGVKQPVTTRGAELVIVASKPPTPTPQPTLTVVPPLPAQLTASPTRTRIQPTMRPSLTATQNGTSEQPGAAASQNDAPAQLAVASVQNTPVKLVEAGTQAVDQVLTYVTVCGFSGATLLFGLAVWRLTLKRRKNLLRNYVPGEVLATGNEGESKPGKDNKKRHPWLK